MKPLFLSPVLRLCLRRPQSTKTDCEEGFERADEVPAIQLPEDVGLDNNDDGGTDADFDFDGAPPIDTGNPVAVPRWRCHGWRCNRRRHGRRQPGGGATGGDMGGGPGGGATGGDMGGGATGGDMGGGATGGDMGGGTMGGDMGGGATGGDMGGGAKAAVARADAGGGGGGAGAGGRLRAHRAHPSDCAAEGACPRWH